MRPISLDVYGIPRQRVIGSSSALAYTSNERGGTITNKPQADYLDDGPQQPIRIWSRTGRRPLLAAGNSNGDVPMLHLTQHPDKPSLRLLVLHDDDERESDHTTGAEQALDHATRDDWTVISVKNDWATVLRTGAPKRTGAEQRPHWCAWLRTTRRPGLPLRPTTPMSGSAIPSGT